MTRKLIIWVVLFMAVQNLKAQFVLDGEFRPRTEFRHGFGNIIADSVNAGYAVATRIRLNAAYAVEAYKFYVSLQDVLLWGENRQLKPEDSNNSFSIFEAWAEIGLGGGFSAKFGRQLLSYDDERILGTVDWTQQARNHDAALLKFGSEKFKADLGVAFNQDFDDPAGFQSVGSAYNTMGFFSYKTMQFLYLKQSWENLSGSLLLLNNGFQEFEGDGITGNGTSYLQTIGVHWQFKKGNFNSSLNAFLQTGEHQNNSDVSGAYLLGLDFGYQATGNFGFSLGMELISGDKRESLDQTEAFFPLYGTNHKFNGFMDYFFVGNHANSIGLLDIHASATLKIGENSGLLVKVLNFSGEQNLSDGISSLGTEIDMVFSKAFKGYTLSLGYSQMFSGDGMYTLKGNTKDAAADSQYWAWAMLTLKPAFLDTAQ